MTNVEHASSAALIGVYLVAIGLALPVLALYLLGCSLYCVMLAVQGRFT